MRKRNKQPQKVPPPPYTQTQRRAQFTRDYYHNYYYLNWNYY